MSWRIKVNEFCITDFGKRLVFRNGLYNGANAEDTSKCSSGRNFGFFEFEWYIYIDWE